ncbi:MAG: SGNH/GDSL hydrolase family protein [Hominimerdicola sp.]
MSDFNISIVNIGDINYMAGVFNKIKNEKKLSIVYLGGSITMGCDASTEENRYVNLSAKWWNNKFPDAQVEWFNAGIGATTSQFGVARANDHVLSKNPDLVFVEFSVNDDNTPLFMETYESLVRNLLKVPTVKAVVIINNLFYDTGKNAQGIHNNIGLHYNLPIVSVRDYIYPEIMAGNVNLSDYTADMLHPKNLGHKMISDLVCNLLDVEYEYYQQLGGGVKPELPEKFTSCRYEDSERFQNYNCIPILNGFSEDTHKALKFSDPFKDGWTAHDKGSQITFKVSGSILMLQWRRTINKPAPVASVTVDGGEKIILDSNFEENWGDLCAITNLGNHFNKGEHTITVTIEQEGKKDSDFMLISVITANK